MSQPLESAVRIKKVFKRISNDTFSYTVFDDGSIYEEFGQTRASAERVVSAYAGEERIQRELYEAVLACTLPKAATA